MPSCSTCKISTFKPGEGGGGSRLKSLEGLRPILRTKRRVYREERKLLCWSTTFWFYLRNRNLLIISLREPNTVLIIQRWADGNVITGPTEWYIAHVRYQYRYHTVQYSSNNVKTIPYRYPNKVPVPVVLLFKTYCRYIKKLISNEPKKPTPWPIHDKSLLTTHKSVCVILEKI